MESQKLEKYSSYSKENNLNHFDTEIQRTAQAAQLSAKKAQTNNDEIVIEIELEDTLNRISQNETVPGTSQSKGHSERMSAHSGTSQTSIQQQQPENQNYHALERTQKVNNSIKYMRTTRFKQFSLILQDNFRNRQQKI
ncbi:Hypothetical_protein [Hexamita inflata]|uniref:Hypothetical_protein n=1 Tax=Hexamita inflata TaxID=28002 RepID=A0ABP1GU59_9EUKA